MISKKQEILSTIVKISIPILFFIGMLYYLEFSKQKTKKQIDSLYKLNDSLNKEFIKYNKQINKRLSDLKSVDSLLEIKISKRREKINTINSDIGELPKFWSN